MVDLWPWKKNPCFEVSIGDTGKPAPEPQQARMRAAERPVEKTVE